MSVPTPESCLEGAKRLHTRDEYEIPTAITAGARAWLLLVEPLRTVCPPKALECGIARESRTAAAGSHSCRQPSLPPASTIAHPTWTITASRPDTRGDRPRVTQGNLGDTICRQGYAVTVRRRHS